MGGSKPEFKPIDNPAAFSNSIFTKVNSHRVYSKLKACNYLFNGLFNTIFYVLCRLQHLTTFIS